MALIHIDFFSETLKMGSQMEVILPQKSGSQIGIKSLENQKKYPVLYLLHGMTDDHTAWIRQTSLERYACERGIAVVMPNGYLGWYTDMQKGPQYYTFVAEEIPEICEGFFACISNKREERFIAGNSMGGYGALKIALRQPGRFAGAASLSGAPEARECVKRNEKTYYPGIVEDMFGEEKTNSGEDTDNLAFLAQNLKNGEEQLPQLYLWCGKEDPLYEQNIRIRDKLEKCRFKVTWKESQGDHSWKYWDIQIQNIMDWIQNQVRRNHG